MLSAIAALNAPFCQEHRISDLGRKDGRQRAVVMSRVPPSSQKVRPLPPRHSVPRAVAVPDRQVAFTTPPHSGPWLTGASRRRWFMFSQAGPERDPITPTRPQLGERFWKSSA